MTSTFSVRAPGMRALGGCLMSSAGVAEGRFFCRRSAAPAGIASLLS